jgi:hypothetical protein
MFVELCEPTSGAAWVEGRLEGWDEGTVWDKPMLGAVCDGAVLREGWGKSRLGVTWDEPALAGKWGEAMLGEEQI